MGSCDNTNMLRAVHSIQCSGDIFSLFEQMNQILSEEKNLWKFNRAVLSFINVY